MLRINATEYTTNSMTDPDHRNFVDVLFSSLLKSVGHCFAVFCKHAHDVKKRVQTVLLLRLQSLFH